MTVLVSRRVDGFRGLGGGGGNNEATAVTEMHRERVGYHTSLGYVLFAVPVPKAKRHKNPVLGCGARCESLLLSCIVRSIIILSSLDEHQTASNREPNNKTTTSSLSLQYEATPQ